MVGIALTADLIIFKIDEGTTSSHQGQPTMVPTQELIDELYREQVLRARATPPEQKILDGPRLFEFACQIMTDGIRDENPGVDEHQVKEILAKRLDLLRRLEQAP